MIAMTDYLIEIEYAASHLIQLIWEERNHLRTLEQELATLSRRVEENYHRASVLLIDAEDLDDIALATGMHWENYFGDDKKLYNLAETRSKLESQINIHAFSVGSLAGSLLEYAKQGIVLTHGRLEKCPNGRAIGKQTLRNVIWQGRNQAIHWIEKDLKPPVKECFDDLAEYNQAFTEYNQRNLAFDVVALLEWTDFAKFKADLLSLA